MSVKEKVPAPTPPHKGEGLNVRPSPYALSNVQHAVAPLVCETVPQLSPSPLWGGVLMTAPYEIRQGTSPVMLGSLAYGCWAPSQRQNSTIG